MHGVLVLGDLRIHYATCEQEPTRLHQLQPAEFGATHRIVDAWIYGGAFMVSDLINLALFDRIRPDSLTCGQLLHLFKRLSPILAFFAQTARTDRSSRPSANSLADVVDKIIKVLPTFSEWSSETATWVHSLDGITFDLLEVIAEAKAFARPDQLLARKIIARRLISRLSELSTPAAIEPSLRTILEWLTSTLRTTFTTFDAPELLQPLEQALTQLNGARTPVLLAYDEPAPDDAHDLWDYSWKLAKHPPFRLAQERFALFTPVGRSSPRSTSTPRRPTLETGLRHLMLSPDDSYTIREQRAELCKVDILVFDDLDKSFRKDSAQHLQNGHAQLVHKVLDSFESRIGADSALPHRPDVMPLIQPMVIVCLKRIPADACDFANGDTYWSRLIRHEGMCYRTLVVLDADDLRRDGFRISESRSWELTAQDFIDELQTSDRLRELRRVGHLVVRFGVTGVLYARRDHFDWTFGLYFAPEYDEREFTAGSDGVILGYGAIMVAAVVRALWCRCEESGNRPLVTSVDEVMEDGILHGLRSCFNLCRLGYGDPADEQLFHRKTTLEPLHETRHRWYRGFPRDLFLGSLHFDDILQLQSSRMRPERISRISQGLPMFAVTPVFAPPTPLWSFLSQSCRNRIASTAMDIALYGVDTILNQPTWSARRVRLALKSRIQMSSFQRAWVAYLPEKHAPSAGSGTVETALTKSNDSKDRLLSLFITEVTTLAPLASRAVFVQERIAVACRQLLEQPLKSPGSDP